MNGFRVAVRAVVALVGCGFLRGHLPQRRLGRDRRVREGRAAHSTEPVFRAVIVPAMGTANIHGFKHIAFVGWQKGCCCWQLLTRRFYGPLTLDPACFTALSPAC